MTYDKGIWHGVASLLKQLLEHLASLWGTRALDIDLDRHEMGELKKPPFLRHSGGIE
jgi:hypothetical protein